MAWKCPGWLALEDQLKKGVFREVAPLGGSIGKDGDCLVIVGMQNDFVHGSRAVAGADCASFVVQQILISMQARIQARWCIAVAKDYIPSDHCVFQDRMGRQGKQRYCLSGSPGSNVHWRIEQAVSHIRALVPKRVVVGFKSYHEQIHSPAAFQYTKEYIDELRDAGLHRDRDASRLVAKLLVYTGCITPTCSGIEEPTGVCMGNISTGPDIMALVPTASPTPPFHEAILRSLVKKQIRRLFVVGLPFEEDVIDTAITAKERKIVSDVYIILDACRAENPTNSAALEKIARLMDTHGLKITTYRCAVLTVPKLMYIPMPSGGVLCYPHRGQGDYADLYSPESGVKDKDQKLPKPAVSFSEAPKKSTDLRGSSADSISKLVAAAPPFRDYVVRNEFGEWDPTIADAPQVFIPTKYRLGSQILQWLGRDETRSVEIRHGIPGVVLRTRFPTSLTSLTMVLGGVMNKTTNKHVDPTMAKIYGPRSFQLTCESAISIISSCGFMTQYSAMTDIRRVLQKIVTLKSVPYFMLRMGYAVSAIVDPSVDLSSQMVIDAERSYASARVRGTEEEKAAALWRVDRISEQAADWKAELFTMRNAGLWLDTKREKLRDGWAKRAFDDILQYSVSELASFCCTVVDACILTQSTETENNQLELNKGGTIVIVTAAAIDFLSRDVGPIELGKYIHGDGEWLPRALQHLELRLSQTWRCILAAFQQRKCSTASLSMLGCTKKALTMIPEHLRNDIVRTTAKALFRLLEEPWGLGQVYVYAGDHLEILEGEVQSGYTFLCSVVVHVKDPKGVCRAASLELAPGTASGLLCCGSVEAVMFGVVGGQWEKGTDTYGDEEDIANNTTLLLSHIGVRPKGLESETVYFHPDATPIKSILGPPGNKPWFNPFQSSAANPSPQQPVLDAAPTPPTNALSQLMHST
eukprot:TRINITY_DN23492_c0_g1_i1.p1 TRINITY_DN23492_c0_g1~~TRINITY_DN23492_c0_g1_i1.p1  ORF type:complete len:924 (+),score=128.63 TRINITY_DN23492_c0_g1_i1:45-2816(+)